MKQPICEICKSGMNPEIVAKKLVWICPTCSMAIDHEILISVGKSIRKEKAPTM